MTHEKVVAYLLQERLAIFKKTENMKLSRDTIAIPHISVGELLKNSHTCAIPLHLVYLPPEFSESIVFFQFCLIKNFPSEISFKCS